MGGLRSCEEEGGWGGRLPKVAVQDAQVLRVSRQLTRLEDWQGGQEEVGRVRQHQELRHEAHEPQVSKPAEEATVSACRQALAEDMFPRGQAESAEKGGEVEELNELDDCKEGESLSGSSL